MTIIGKKKSYWILTLISILIGLTFIYSAYTKLFPIEIFEVKLVELGITGWHIAPFLARFIIGTELFLGTVFLANIRVSRKFYLISIVLLTLFSLQLLFQIIIHGNEGNCGCFSNAISMTPGEGIVKNIIMIAIILLLYFFYNGIKFPGIKWIVIAVFAAGLSLPFILNPVLLNSTYHSNNNKVLLPIESLYRDKIISNSTDLRKGKWVIAFLSLTCPHCKTAAYKFKVMKDKSPELPIYFFLNGDDEELDLFLKESGAKNIPFTRLKSGPFIQMSSGTSLPAIYLVHDQKIIKQVNYISLGQTEIENWLDK